MNRHSLRVGQRLWLIDARMPAGLYLVEVVAIDQAVWLNPKTEAPDAIVPAVVRKWNTKTGKPEGSLIFTCEDFLEPDKRTAAQQLEDTAIEAGTAADSFRELLES